MSSKFVVVQILFSSMEAQFAKGALEANGIAAEVRGAKEYSAHYTGIDNGRYEILVSEENLEEAQKILREKATLNEEVQIKKYTKNEFGVFVLNPEYAKRNSIRKTTLLWLMSIILIPVVGNFFSLYQSWQLLKDRKNLNQFDQFFLFAIVAMNIVWMILFSAYIAHS